MMHILIPPPIQMRTLDGKLGTDENGKPVEPMLFRQFVYGRLRDPAFGSDDRSLDMDAVLAVSRILAALDPAKETGLLVLEDDHYKRLLRATKNPSKQIVCPTCGSRGGYNADAWTLIPFMEAITTAVSAQPDAVGWIETQGGGVSVAAE